MMGREGSAGGAVCRMIFISGPHRLKTKNKQWRGAFPSRDRGLAIFPAGRRCAVSQDRRVGGVALVVSTAPGLQSPDTDWGFDKNTGRGGCEDCVRVVRPLQWRRSH